MWKRYIYFDEHFEGKVNLVEKVESRTGALSKSELNYTVCSHCFDKIVNLIHELVEERSKKDDEEFHEFNAKILSTARLMKQAGARHADFGVNEND